MGISHGEDAVSVASATMPRRTARLPTVRSCTHTAAMAVAGQVFIVSRGRNSVPDRQCCSERSSTRTRAAFLPPVAQNVVCKSPCNDPLSGLISTLKFGRCCHRVKEFRRVLTHLTITIDHVKTPFWNDLKSLQSKTYTGEETWFGARVQLCHSVCITRARRGGTVQRQC